MLKVLLIISIVINLIDITLRITDIVSTRNGTEEAQE